MSGGTDPESPRHPEIAALYKRSEEIERYLAHGYEGDPAYLAYHKLGVAISVIDSLLQGGTDERIARKLFAEWQERQR